MSQTFVIIGAGHAAGQLAASLRSEGFEGRILVIGEEPYIPYQRPPLSKKYLAGELALERVYFKPQMFYDKQNVEFMLNTRVSAIDPKSKTISLDSGDSLSYDKLALTTGSRVRQLTNLPGVDLKNVFYLRTIEDVDAIQNCFTQGGKLIVVGGGYIGLEVAAVAVKRGIETTVLEMDERVMSRVVAPEMSAFYTRIHTEEGVNVRTGVRVTGFEGDGQLEAAVCSDGQRFDANFAIIGVGIIPNSELAAEAGLEVDNGIVVDEYAQTSDPDIVAAGDCTNHPNGILERRIRLESVQNALDQAKVAAAAMCNKRSNPIFVAQHIGSMV
ncbi:MAG: FAD-dependent oxidoreductase [Pseudomonadota bacterium]